MDKCKHGFDHACLICGFTHIDGKKVWFDWAWQEQQKRIDELQARVDELTSIATELAEYASYAEIVGGVTVNRAAVRSFCDKVFDFNRKSDDQYIEQAFKGGEA